MQQSSTLEQPKVDIAAVPMNRVLHTSQCRYEPHIIWRVRQSLLLEESAVVQGTDYSYETAAMIYTGSGLAYCLSLDHQHYTVVHLTSGYTICEASSETLARKCIKSLVAISPHVNWQDTYYSLQQAYPDWLSFCQRVYAALNVATLHYPATFKHAKRVVRV